MSDENPKLPKQEHTLVITKETGVTLGLFIAVVGAAIAFTLEFSGEQAATRDEMHVFKLEMKSELLDMKSTIKEDIGEMKSTAKTDMGDLKGSIQRLSTDLIYRTEDRIKYSEVRLLWSELQKAFPEKAILPLDDILGGRRR